jgi:hypothetical protein
MASKVIGKNKIIGASMLVVILGIVVALLTSTTGDTQKDDMWFYHADYIAYENQDTLTVSSDTIVSGTVIDRGVRKINIAIPVDSDDPFINPSSTKGMEVNSEINSEDSLSDLPAPGDKFLTYTVSKVRVSEVYRGNVSVGDVIEIKQLGGFIDGTEYRSDSEKYLSINEQYLLFLLEYADKGMPYCLLNPTQAQYKSTNGVFKKVSTNGFNLDMERLRTQTSLIRADS